MMDMNHFLKITSKSSSFINDDKLSTVINSKGQDELEEDDLDLVSAASGNLMNYGDFLCYVNNRSDKDGR